MVFILSVSIAHRVPIKIIRYKCILVKGRSGGKIKKKGCFIRKSKVRRILWDVWHIPPRNYHFYVKSIRK
jgi:hypothetical protein